MTAKPQALDGLEAFRDAEEILQSLQHAAPETVK